MLELISLRRTHTAIAKGDEDSVPVPKRRTLMGSFAGWRGSLYLFSSLCLFVLCINIAFFFWGAARHSFSSRIALFTGDCDKAKHLNLGVHLVINILSSGLLAASNYCMQCLCAPTRGMVDRAHKRKHWLDIGVPSIRNLRSLPRFKLCLWVALAFSSLPLHLVYNSTVFSTVGAHSYDVYLGNSTFTSQAKSGVPRLLDGWGKEIVTASFTSLAEQSANGTTERLTPAECIDAYAVNYQTKYGSVILISDDFHWNFTLSYTEVVLGFQDMGSAYDWICHGTGPWYDECASKDIVDVRADPENWRYAHSPGDIDFRIDHCLAERLPENCQLECSFPLAMVVMVFNLFKAILICVTAFYIQDAPLLTTGDAAASFIKTPDETTKGRCLLSRSRHHLKHPHSRCGGPKRWGNAVSGLRWAACLLPSLIALVVSIALLAYGLNNLPGSWGTGRLGVIDRNNFISGGLYPKGLIPVTLITNTPQLIYSSLYFTINSLATTMTLAAEWNSYSVKRKGLRVSTTPKGQQRSTYFLSLPYRYALPLLAISSLLHWLISQSFYLVSIQAYDPNGTRNPQHDSMTSAYSPAGIVVTLCVGLFMLACLVGMGLRRFKTGMPVAGSCSLAISAACHPSNTERRVDHCADGGDGEKLGEEYQLLKWGMGPSIQGREAHCAFSSGEVELPREGLTYR